jgi:two-component system OmpR family sensor kinase
MSLPIRVRLTAWYALLLAAVMAAVATFVIARLQTELGQEIDRGLVSAAPQIAQGYDAEGSKEFFDVANTVFPALPVGPAAAQIADARGRVLLAYGGPRARLPMWGPGQLRSALAGRRTPATVSLDGEPFRVLALPVHHAGLREVLVVAKSLRNRDRAVDRLLILLLIAFPAALLAAVAGGWLLARRALRPVEQMTSHADRIGIDRVHERIPVPAANDEVGHLAATLNAMLDRLERGVEEKRRLVADTSHELRTPLAAMRSELDVSLDYDDLPPPAREVLSSVREEVERMTDLVADLLTLARIDEGHLALRGERIDLATLLEGVDHQLAPLAAGTYIELDLSDAAVVVGDLERLREVATNLVANAIKFAGPGAHVRIATWHAGDESGFSVQDDGPGIPADAQAHVFDRFWRGDRSRGRDGDGDGGGNGLGLAICREIVEAHGGRIWVQSRPGGGSRFVVALPAATAAGAPTPA